LINRFKFASKKVLLSVLIFLIFVYVTVLLCTIPTDFTISFENGKMTPSHIGVLIIKDTNEKFISLLKLDLGRTGKDDRSLNYLVTSIMKDSLLLLAGGMILAVLLGITKGIIDSKRGSTSESSLKVLSTIIPISLPDILIIALLQRLALLLNNHGIEIFRVGGGGTINHVLLPIIALSILPACYIARITSMAIDNCYQKDFIKVAVGKGCSSYRVLWNHAMRNAIPSVIDSFPTITSIIIGNLLMVEKLFSYPGLTQSLLNFYSRGERDGVIANILLIGIIYFILDAAFNMLKWMMVKPLREESL
jgi:ABC-type dipeptide/oligopeptide/nickel transport system permease component